MGNKTYTTTLSKALNFVLSNDGDGPQLPEWILLVPKGNFKGRDGREFENLEPALIIDWIVNVNQKDIQWDIQHASEDGELGADAPAQAWIYAKYENFQVRKATDEAPGGIYARVDWQNGKWLILNKAYRYYSPVFQVYKDSIEIAGVTSVGLTNEPNLYLPALNQKQQEPTMDLESLIAALGLSSDATMDDCVAAVNKMKTDHVAALNKKQPDMKEFIPRADYEAQRNRADTAEKALADQAKVKLDADIEAALNKAQEDGKITPASRDYYKAQCEKDGGLDEFNEFIKSATPVVSGDAELNKGKPAGTTASLNKEEKEVADMLGQSYEEFAAAKAEENK